MTMKTVRRIEMAGNVLLGASLLIALVWWPLSVRLFASGWVLCGIAWLIRRAKAGHDGTDHGSVPVAVGLSHE